MWRGWVAAWLVSVACLGAFAQDAPGKTVAEAQRRLLQVAVSEMETDVPVAAQVGIRELKAALGRETDAVMAGLPAAGGRGGSAAAAACEDAVGRRGKDRLEQAADGTSER